MDRELVVGQRSEVSISSLPDTPHRTEAICKLQKDKIMGVVLLILALLVGAVSALLLKKGFSSIPSFSTGISFALATLGLFGFSMVLLCRKSIVTPLSKEQKRVYRSMTWKTSDT